MKIESIKKLRKICQPKYEAVKYNAFYRIYKRFFRIFSIYITRFLIYLRVSADMASIFSIIFGLLGFLYFVNGKFILGSIFLQLWFLADTLDGELARYYFSKHKQKNYLTKGEFLDLNSHHLVHSLVFIGLSVGLFLIYDKSLFLYLGISSLLALLLNELIDLNKIKVLYYQNLARKSTPISYKKKSSLISRFMTLYTFPSVINLIFIFSLFGSVEIVLYFYGLTFLPIVMIKFIKNNIKKW